MEITGLIQAAGSGNRLGLGPKAFVQLGGRTLLEHSVALLQRHVSSIVVAVPPTDVERAASLLASSHTRIIAGGMSRSETTRLLISKAEAPWLVLHDVVHPFASAELIANLLKEATQNGAAAPGLVNSEFLYQRDGVLLCAPGDVLVGQKPVAFPRAAALAGYRALADNGLEDDPSFLNILELGGVHTRFVPGSATNIKITTPEDLRLAEALWAVAH
jgi:2-C-methyl-D-erythritol 4-phosphate cytidylyltransferase